MLGRELDTWACDMDGEMACRWPPWPPVQRVLNPKETCQHNEADIADTWCTTWGKTGWVWGAQMVKRTIECRHVVMSYVIYEAHSMLIQLWCKLVRVGASGNSHDMHGMWIYNGLCTFNFFFLQCSLPSTCTTTLDCIYYVDHKYCGRTSACSCIWNWTDACTCAANNPIQMLSLLDNTGELSFVVSGPDRLTLHSINSFRIWWTLLLIISCLMVPLTMLPRLWWDLSMSDAPGLTHWCTDSTPCQLV